LKVATRLRDCSVDLGFYFSGAEAHRLIRCVCGTAEEAAEKLADSGKSGGKHPSGAKARHLYCCICGTTEVVPFQSNLLL
jgi:hypothetical protein